MIQVAQEPVYLDADGGEITVAVVPATASVNLSYARNAQPFTTVAPGNFVTLHRPCWATGADGPAQIIVTTVFDDGAFPEGAWGYGPPSGIHTEGRWTDRIAPGRPSSEWVQYLDGVPVASTIIDGGSAYATPGTVLVAAGTDYTLKKADSAKSISMAGGRVLVRTQDIEFTEPSNFFHVANVGDVAIPIVFDSGVAWFPTGSLSIAAQSSVDFYLLAPDAWEVRRAAVAAPPPSAPALSGAGPAITSDNTTITLTTPGAYTPAVGSGTTVSWIFQREATLNAGDWGDLTGEVAATHTIVSGDRTHRVRVHVTATANGLSADFYSNVLTIPALNIPANTVPPQLTLTDNSVPAGPLEVNTVIKCQLGTWTNTPDTYSVRAVVNGVSRGTAVFDGTHVFTYTLQQQDVGGSVHWEVGASNVDGGSAYVSSSNSVTVVAAGTTAVGARDAALQPFASKAWPNMPISLGATYEAPSGTNATQQFQTGASGGFINSDQYSVPVTQAATTDPLATITDTKNTWSNTSDDVAHPNIRIPNKSEPGGVIAKGTDAAIAIINPTHDTLNEAWNTVKDSSTAYRVGAYGTCKIDETGNAVGGGTRASGFPNIAGLIRKWEVDAGAINHALVCGTPSTMASQTPKWPAIGVDGYSGSYGPNGNGSGGNVQFGALFAIPQSQDLNAIPGVSGNANWLMLAKALQTYGVRPGDTEAPGNGTKMLLAAEPSLYNTTALNDLISAWSTLYKWCRRVTNDSQTAIGGPDGTTGTYGNGRLAAFAPLANSTVSPAPGTPTQPVMDSDFTLALFSALGATSWGHTVGNGSNRYLLAIFFLSSTYALSAAPQFNGVSLTLLGSATSTAGSTARQVVAYGLANPPSGNFNLTWPGLSGASGNYGVAIMSFANVNQATPVGTIDTDQGDTASTLFLQAGSATSDLVVFAGAARSLDTKMTASTGLIIPSGPSTWLASTNMLTGVATATGSASPPISQLSFTPQTTGGDKAAGLAIPLKFG